MFRLQVLFPIIGVLLVLAAYVMFQTHRVQDPGPPQTSSQQPPPKTKDMCYVSAVVGSQSDYALGAMVLGHSIRKTSAMVPRALRIVLVSRDVPTATRMHLEKVWDRVIQMPDVMRGVAASYMFKLNAWKLGSICARVLWLGSDVVVQKPLDFLFTCNPLPCGVPDQWIWYNHMSTNLSPAVNGDSLVFQPSHDDFNGLLKQAEEEEALNLLPVPLVYGPWDQRVINKYFNGRFTVVPWYTSVQADVVTSALQGFNTRFENETAFAIWSSRDDWRAVHFSCSKPWKSDRATSSPYLVEVWRFWDNACSHLMQEYPEIALDLRQCLA